MKPSTKARRVMLGTLLAGSTMLATGCSSGGFPLASMNPFSSTPGQPSTISKMTNSVASTANGARNQASTLGTTVKSAWGKSTNAVAGIFGGGEPDPADPAIADDPLRLDNGKTIGPEVLVANGQLWESTGDFNKAMESYVKALESEPNNGPALTSIARLHFRQGNHKQAVEFFQRAINNSPQEAGLHNDLGLTLSKLGDHAGAVQSLQRALQLAPGTSRYANNLASVKFESGDPQAAFSVLSTNNKPAVAHFNMAYLHFKRGQMNEARGHLGQAMKYEPQAGEDTAVKRAVDRSRDMLAQINSSMSPIAQAGPQATIASLPNTPTVQQTSQALPPGAKPNVSPVSAKSWNALTAPTMPTTPPANVPTTPTGAAPSWGLPNTMTPGAGTPSPTAPSAGLPTSGTPSAGLPSAGLPSTGLPTAGVPTAPSTTGAEKPSFSLPTGFNPTLGQ